MHRDYAADLPRIEAYGSELNQVWTNLIDNAIDAMKGRGRSPCARGTTIQWAVVEVEDTGPGIPEAIQAHIFDPFFTTKAPGEGTGLGLNITHNHRAEAQGAGSTSTRSRARPASRCGFLLPERK